MTATAWSGLHSARTATTSRAPCYRTPAPPSCGGERPSTCCATWLALSGGPSGKRRGASGCPSAGWPSSSAAASCTCTPSSGRTASTGSRRRSRPTTWPEPRCPPAEPSRSPTRLVSLAGAARSTSRFSTALPVPGPSRWLAMWPSTPPRALTAAAPSTRRSARKRTWPADLSRRICAGWPRPPGPSVPTLRSSPTACAATPTGWATAATSCPSRSATPRASAPSRLPGRPGGRQCGGVVTPERRPTVLPSGVCVPSGSAGPAGERSSGPGASSGSASRSAGSATRSGTAGRSRIWSDGERG